MGYDKTQIEYHGVPQKEYMMEMLSRHCDKVFISLSKHRDEKYPFIEDEFKGLGPFGGILSAFRNDPNSAWLSIAADIPLIDDNTISYLIQNRNPGTFATCFYNPETNFS